MKRYAGRIRVDCGELLDDEEERGGHRQKTYEGTYWREVETATGKVIKNVGEFVKPSSSDEVTIEEN